MMGKVSLSGIVPKLKKPSRLPAGFTELVYIESSGTQRIDSGFAPNQNTRVVCKAVCPVGSSTNFLFGARTSSGTGQFMFAGSTSGYYTSGYGSAQKAFSESNNSSGVIIVDKNKNITTITYENETSASVTGSTATFSCSRNIVLFGCNTGGSISYGKAKIYSCQIYDNGTMVRDFVPCLSDADGIGMYDMVNGKFYPNAGTGVFIGSEVA